MNEVDQTSFFFDILLPISMFLVQQPRLDKQQSQDGGRDVMVLYQI